MLSEASNKELLLLHSNNKPILVDINSVHNLEPVSVFGPQLRGLQP
jgi:hypothetical protein